MKKIAEISTFQIYFQSTLRFSLYISADLLNKKLKIQTSSIWHSKECFVKFIMCFLYSPCSRIFGLNIAVFSHYHWLTVQFSKHLRCDGWKEWTHWIGSELSLSGLHLIVVPHPGPVRPELAPQKGVSQGTHCEENAQVENLAKDVLRAAGLDTNTFFSY